MIKIRQETVVLPPRRAAPALTKLRALAVSASSAFRGTAKRPGASPCALPGRKQAHPVLPTRDAQVPCRNDPNDQRGGEGQELKRERGNEHPDRQRPSLICHRPKRQARLKFGVSRVVFRLAGPARASVSATPTFLYSPPRSAPGTDF